MASARDTVALVKILTAIAASVALAVAVSLPLVHYLISYHALEGIIATEAEIHAGNVSQVITSDPLMWRFHLHLLTEVLARRQGPIPEYRRVADFNGGVVAETGAPLRRPVLTRSFPLYDAGHQVGTLTIAVSLVPLLMRTAIVAAAAAFLGIGVFVSLRVLPLRALKRAWRILMEREEDLRAARGFLEHLIASGPVVIFRTSLAKLRFSYLSPNVERLLGYTAAEVEAQPDFWVEHIHPHDRNPVKDALTQVRERRQIELIYRFSHKERRYVWLQSVLRVEPGGQEDGDLVGYVQDISAQKNAEDTLKGLYLDLQRKTLALEEQNRQVEEASRLKDQFLASMSHELRTPLNAIIGFSELLQRERMGHLNVEQHEYLTDVLRSARHLLTLINDILDLAKIGAGKMAFKPEPLDLAELVRQVVEGIGRLAMEKGLLVERAVDPELSDIVLDPAKLKQVLYNFLSNAVKFTPAQGKVDVRVLPEGVDRLRIEVEDTGIGIAADDLPGLFAEFHQLDTGITRKYAGTGLGLALTKRIVEAQGGRVGVVSAVGQGSRFFAVLPRQHDTAVATRVPEVVRHGG